MFEVIAEISGLLLVKRKKVLLVGSLNTPTSPVTPSACCGERSSASWDSPFCTFNNFCTSAVTLRITTLL